MLVSEILRIKGNALFTTTPDAPVVDAVKVMAQHDTPVITSRWPIGQTVSYFHPIRLPADLPAGNYRLEVGLYLPESPLVRLPPLDRANDRDVAQIAEIVVAP